MFLHCKSKNVIELKLGVEPHVFGLVCKQRTLWKSQAWCDCKYIQEFNWRKPQRKTGVPLKRMDWFSKDICPNQLKFIHLELTCADQKHCDITIDNFVLGLRLLFFCSSLVLHSYISDYNIN